MSDQPNPPHQSTPPSGQGYPPAAASPTPPSNPYDNPAVAPPSPYGQPGGYAQQGGYGQQGFGQQAVPGTLPSIEAHFGPVATFGPRVLAALIDMAVNLLGLIPFIAGMVVLISSLAASDYDPVTGSEVTVESSSGLVIGFGLMLLSMLLLLAIGLWNRVFRMGRTGQSVGKQVVGLRLINGVTGAPIGAGSAFLREIVNGLANQVFYLGALWMLWDSNRQTLGDMAVKSSVIKVAKR